jgi:23S rRNA pseudouridine1911/1915/1917 synthase
MQIHFNQPSATTHAVAQESVKLSELLFRELFIEEKEFRGLISLGAIFINHKRVFEDQILSKEDYVRIHRFPKRYEVSHIDWRTRIVFENEDFIVINKPTGVPVHATLDNAFENISHQLATFLGSTLFVTQRLDVPVSGILLFAKTKKFQVYFNRLLSQRLLEKQYEALTRNSPPLGHHTHYMEKSLSAPKVLSAAPLADGLQCELEILSSTPTELGYRNRIRLLTGRTHQIRAQLSFLNCPILGDTSYGGEIGLFSTQTIALHSTFLAFKNFEFTIPSSWPHDSRAD